jgi:hypothetical protein
MTGIQSTKDFGCYRHNFTTETKAKDFKDILTFQKHITLPNE